MTQEFEGGAWMVSEEISGRFLVAHETEGPSVKLPSWQIHRIGAHRPIPCQRPEGTSLFPKRLPKGGGR
jgi:hypothetical protein